MLIYNEGQTLDTKEMKLLGGNGEGIFYAGESVIKVYDDAPKKRLLDENDVNYLAKIKTLRILLPKNPIYVMENGQKIFKGYARHQYIQNCIPLSAMWETLPEKLEEEGKYIEEDVEILTENNVKLHDLAVRDNLLYNGNLYFCDPSTFTINSDTKVTNNNKEELKEALHYHLILLGTNPEYLEEELAKMTGIDYQLSEDFYNFLLNVYGSVYDMISDYSYFEYLNDILEYYGSIENYKLELLEKAIEDSRYSRYSFEVETLERILHR